MSVDEEEEENGGTPPNGEEGSSGASIGHKTHEEEQQGVRCNVRMISQAYLTRLGTGRGTAPEPFVLFWRASPLLYVSIASLSHSWSSCSTVSEPLALVEI